MELGLIFGIAGPVVGLLIGLLLNRRGYQRGRAVERARQLELVQATMEELHRRRTKAHQEAAKIVQKKFDVRDPHSPPLPGMRRKQRKPTK